jgi:FolB domain-containing protein
MDKIFIEDLMVRGIIGVSDRERAQPQDIVINAVLFSDISKGGKSDNINDCVNYRTVAKAIIRHIHEVSRYTVEALAEDIAEICLNNSQVKQTTVRVEKPGAVRFSKSVGVEITRENKTE